MGMYADMLLEGDLCANCGEPIFEDGEPTEGEGIPDYCSDACAEEAGADWWLEANRS